MVNRMLFNHIPYAAIVAALADLDIIVTERNISNWKTRGGYKEWCDAQDRALEIRLLQDNLTEYLHKNELQTIVGPVRYGPDGEWSNPRVVQAQFRGVTDKNVDQFRQPGKQVVLYPPQYKTGNVVSPFEKARGK